MIEKERVDSLYCPPANKNADFIFALLIPCLFFNILASGANVHSPSSTARIFAALFSFLSGSLITLMCYWLMKGLSQLSEPLDTPMKFLTGYMALSAIVTPLSIFYPESDTVEIFMGVAGLVIGLFVVIKIINNYSGALQRFAKSTLICPALLILTIVILMVLMYLDLKPSRFITISLGGLVASIVGKIKDKNAEQARPANRHIFNYMIFLFADIFAMGVTYGISEKFEVALALAIAIGVLATFLYPLILLVRLFTSYDKEVSTSSYQTPASAYSVPESLRPNNSQPKSPQVAPRPLPQTPAHNHKVSPQKDDNATDRNNTLTKILSWGIIILTAILSALIATLIKLNNTAEVTTPNATEEFNENESVTSGSGHSTIKNESLSATESSEAFQETSLQAKYLMGGTSAMLNSNGKLTYHPKNMLDGNLASCWAIDQKRLISDPGGRGNDCVVSFKLPSCKISEIIIYNGYQKNQDLYYKNCRPKGIVITYGSDNANLIDETIYAGELKDTYGAQVIRLNKPLNIDSKKQINIFVDPDNIYHGNRYTDICLSEVEFHGVYD